MGQVQSDEYETTEDVADSEINSRSSNTKNSAQEHRENSTDEKRRATSKCRQEREQKQQQNGRKLSTVSHRNIQLLSMKPRSEKDVFADGLRSRRRSSLINLILGVPSSGPRFSDDLCSLSSHHVSECNFGIEFFPDVYRANTSVSSLRLESIDDLERGGGASGSDVTRASGQLFANQSRRRSSVGSGGVGQPCDNPSGLSSGGLRVGLGGKAAGQQQDGQQARIQQFTSASASPAKSHLTSTLASIDLTSSFERHDKLAEKSAALESFRPPLCKTKQTIFEIVSRDESGARDLESRAAKGRVNQSGRVLRRSGSELSLYSTVSSASATTGSQRSQSKKQLEAGARPMEQQLRETKLIIILQVCLPFILAGFGNMAAGLMLNQVAQWRVFRKVPAFFILLPPFVGLKGNIEMTLASRLSTLSNLNLLQTGRQRVRAFQSNLVLILSQAIGLSVFAALVSILCELLMGTRAGTGWPEELKTAFVVVLASALATSILLALVSSVVIPLAVALASLIQVNPDNLSTLIAALYGDVSCVLVYGLIADWMFALKEQNSFAWPVAVIAVTLISWPVLLIFAYKFKETNRIALSSIPPMMASIVVSIGSGFVLALVVGRFHLIALYQPVVNGFGANLIAVQASRVSTWLWCTRLALNGPHPSTNSISNNTSRETSQDELAAAAAQKKISGGLSASFTPATKINECSGGQVNEIGDIKEKSTRSFGIFKQMKKVLTTILWSFCNSSPNAIAARLLLIMLVPAQTLYFFVIWILSSADTFITLTWQLYIIYIALCVVQVFILLMICEPFMTLLMKRDLDPDIFGISLLMALADLTGTVCLAGAFLFLAWIGDPNVA